MRYDEMSPELKEALKEKAQMCETSEERLAFIQENNIELTDEQLDDIAGGRFEPPWQDACPKRPDRQKHVWENTGRTKPGKWLGDWWPDKEKRCIYCGKTKWVR